MSLFGKIGSMFGKKSSSLADGIDKSVLLDKIRQTELFKDVPPQNLQEMYGRMETVGVSKGDVVIKEGDEGDYYYLLAVGTATVTRKAQAVAALTGPTGFGEEALISNAKRNATITMTSDGVLMRLSKDTFNDHVKEPLVTWFSHVEAQEKIASGWKWIDVRYATEAHQSRLHAAIELPMEELRARMAGLDKGLSYICYCENGRQSSTAAFLLRQHGFKVGVLRGGLLSLKRAGIA